MSKIQNNPMLGKEHIANCKLFVDRLEMVKELAKPGTVGAELGIWDGDFSEALLRYLRPQQLHLFDIVTRPKVLSRFSGQLSGPVLTLHEGDSSANLSALPDAYFDWIYIDGDHSYDGVKRDADVSVRKMKPDGLLFFNDYKMGDHNVPEGFYPYGIIPVVNDLCINQGFEMIAFAFHIQMYCDVAIRKRR